jgi:Tol biopolymer transport system component
MIGKVKYVLTLALLPLMACQEQIASPEANGPGSEVAFKKGDNPGGGGGKEEPPPDPAIVYAASTSCSGWFGLSLWVTNGDGSNTTDLGQCGDTVVVAFGGGPSWSPDGMSFVFNTSSPVAATVMKVVDVAFDAEGHPVAQNQRQLVVPDTQPQGFDPVWSPLGDVFFNDTATTEIYTVPAAGGDPAMICEGCGEAPTWNPDGTKLAFQRHGKLLVLTLADGSVETLISEGFFLIYWPDWSRSGDKIAFTGATEENGPRATYVLDVVTKQYSLLTDIGWPASWSPDDTELVINKRSRGRGGLFVIDSQTGEVLRRLAGASMWSDPDWRRCAPGPGCGPGS